MEAEHTIKDKMDEKAIVQATRRLQKEINELGLGKSASSKTFAPKPEDFAGLYDILVKSKVLRDTTRKLFLDGHYARSVEEAYKCLNNIVKSRSGISKDGQDLMNQAFSEKNPILKVNELRTESHRNEQIGYMLILAGCMTGIRNPRAHEHQLWDSPDVALELLAWANHLMRILDKAKRVRKRKKALTP